MAQDKETWRAVVNAVMNLGVPYNARHFLPSRRTVSSRSLLHEVIHSVGYDSTIFTTRIRPHCRKCVTYSPRPLTAKMIDICDWNFIAVLFPTFLMSRINTCVAEVGCMFMRLVVVEATAAAPAATSNTICRLSNGMPVCMLRMYLLVSHLLGKYSVW